MRPAAWTTREVAQRASVSTRTVQRWIESGGLPARRVGRTLRVEPAEFEAWWEAQATRQVQQPAPERRVVPAPVEGYGPWPHPQAERLRRMRTALKRPGVWVTGPLTRRKLYPPTRSTH